MLSDDDFDFDNFRIGSAFELYVLHDPADKDKPMNGGTIPVRKIFVNNVNPNLNQKDIMQVFGVYGKIFKIGYPRFPDGSRKNYIFITYFSPKDAEKALNAKTQIRKKHRFYLHPADQWHQPLELPDGQIQWFRGNSQGDQNGSRPEYSSNVGESVEESSSSEPDGPINGLNDDCLVQIFSFLSKRELIGIERVCKRWRDLSLSLWLKETSLDFKNVFVMKNESDHLYTDHFRELLLRCGEHITTLDISHKTNDFNADRTLQIISKHCKNLNHLNISQLQIKKGGFASLAKEVAPKLKSLYLDRCKGLNDTLLAPVLESATQLELLSVPRTGIHGPSLKCLSKACKNLNIAYCFQFKTDILAQILKECTNIDTLKADGILGASYSTIRPCAQNLVSLSVSKTKFFMDTSEEEPTFPNLTSLDISGNFAVNDKMISHLTVMCPQLEKLDLSGCDSSLNSDLLDPSGLSEKGIQQLIKFPKLKYLKINSLKCVTSEVLEYLAVNSKGRFRKVECRACHCLTDSGPSRMVALCSELTSIDVSYCREITAAFLKAALDSVKIRTNKIPLKVKVAGTNIEQDEFQDHHPLLKIDFQISGNDWLTYSIHSSYSDDDDDHDSDNFMDELGFEGFDSDWEAQSMFGDDIEIFEWYQHTHGWNLEHDYDDDDDFDDDDDDDDDDDYGYNPFEF